MPEETEIVFDTETTGLTEAEGSPVDNQPQMIEFGGIKYIDGIEVDSIEFFIEVNQPLDKKIISLTRINDSMLRGQGQFINHLEKLQKFFKGSDSMIAHNVNFDRDILKYELERVGCLLNFPWPRNHICTVEMAKALFSGQRVKLSNLHYELFNEGFEEAHRALPDCRALARCYFEMKKRGIHPFVNY